MVTDGRWSLMVWSQIIIDNMTYSLNKITAMELSGSPTPQVVNKEHKFHNIDGRQGALRHYWPKVWKAETYISCMQDILGRW